MSMDLQGRPFGGEIKLNPSAVRLSRPALAQAGRNLREEKEIRMDDVVIRHNPEWDRFEVLVGGRVIGKAAYKDYDGGPQRIFYHTVINEEYGGQGLAGKLATEALDQTVGAGLNIVPVCPYIKKFLSKHPEYADRATATTTAHLKFLETALAQTVRA
jgi:predicted GNAT family acetyltransferase